MIFIRPKYNRRWRVFSGKFLDYTFHSHEYRIKNIIYTKESPEFVKAYEQEKIMEQLTGLYK